MAGCAAMVEELLRHPFATATEPLRSQVRGSLGGKRQRKRKRQGWRQGEAVWVGVGEQMGHENTLRCQMSCMQVLNAYTAWNEQLVI